MSSVDRELQRRIAKLGPDEKRQVLNYIIVLEDTRPAGTPGSAVVPFAGSISAEDAKEMADAIEEGCEQIDWDGW